MKLSTLLLGLLVLAALAGGFVAYRKIAERRRLWKQFVALEGRDLGEIEGVREVALRLLWKGKADVRAAVTEDLAPWRLVRTGPAVILLERETPESSPGPLRFRAHVFSDDGEPISSVEFLGGWRTRIHEVRTVAGPGVPAPLLRFDGAPTDSGRDVTGQVYGVIGGRLALVRLEDVIGRGRSNVYERPSHTIGPRVPDRTVEEWEDSLRSEDPLEQLRSLLWIGGLHADPKEVPADPATHESVSDVRLVEAVRKRPGVKARLAELERSRNPWVRDAADLASRRNDGG